MISNSKSILTKLQYYKAFGFRYVSNDYVNHSTKHFFSNIDEIKSQLRYCNLCQLCKSRNNAILPSGSFKSNLMVVLESPDINEDSCGISYYGNKAKSLLDILEKNLNTKKDDFYTTFLVKCHISKQLIDIKDPINKCKLYLKNEINILKPKFIITFGENCTNEVLNKVYFPKMDFSHGSIFRLNNSYVMSTYDIRHAISNPSKMNILLQDLKKFKDFMQTIK